MTDPIDSVERERSLKSIGVVSYLLHSIVAVGAVVPGVQASVVLLLIAFVLDLVKKDDAAGSWQESHFRWRIRSVVWAMVLYGVTFPLWFLFFLPGMVAWALISIWFLYRIVRGWINLNANRPIQS
ncbi:hypothetical protein OOT46_04960 [Aquabacterium sp. A7-Y]|uniref:DUF4870 family protein n=1 Tax=Aquabacterium sp. A7-Y TaxID=1349605 RepID=UPI00223E6ECA|nr:hypothetical protein [Aquabacterium sp. A7-Y]MCW7537199.1 hypothetical protein [Aquabacterium sp. A7-Y]